MAFNIVLTAPYWRGMLVAGSLGWLMMFVSLGLRVDRDIFVVWNKTMNKSVYKTFHIQYVWSGPKTQAKAKLYITDVRSKWLLAIEKIQS